MVAVGNLGKVWSTVPEDLSAEAFQQEFLINFRANWPEVLDTADKSFTYNAFNNAYFAIEGIHTIENLTLDKLLENERADTKMNIIVS